MLQRIQSIWLLLAAASGFATLKFPVYGGTHPNTATPPAPVYRELTALGDILILILTIGISVGCLILIFLYKNRPLQMRIAVISLILSVLVIVLYYFEAATYTQGNITLTSLLTVAVPVFIGLAIRGIYKDEKLIKDADRLR